MFRFLCAAFFLLLCVDSIVEWLCRRRREREKNYVNMYWQSHFTAAWRKKFFFVFLFEVFRFPKATKVFFSHSVSVIFSYYSDFYLFKYILIESVEMHVRMHRSESNSGREKKIAARWWWYCAHGKKSTRLATIVLFIHNKLFTKEETFFHSPPSR